MTGRAHLNRRSFVAAIPAIGIATQLPAWTSPPEIVSTEPVLLITPVASASAASELVHKLRRTPGCMKAQALAASDGRFAVFELWVTQRAATATRSSDGAVVPAYVRMEV